MRKRLCGGACSAAQAFCADRSGNVALIFALLLIPIVAATGSAIDYSRANSVKGSMQGALDATALLLSKEASTLNGRQLDTKAQTIFQSQFHRPEAERIRVNATYSGRRSGESTLSVSGSAVVDTTFLRLIGVSRLNVSTTSEVSWGLRKLEVALVLDNTGSMGSLGKIEALKVAAHQFVTSLRNATRNPDDVKFSIVPFDTHVNVGASNASKPWFDWSLLTGASGMTTASAGAGAGAGVASWTGCVIDRTQDYDVQIAPPRPAITATLFPGVGGCTLPEMLPLTNSLSAISAKIDDMRASGYTNTTIGFVWGWNMLTAGAPASTAAAAARNLDKYMVFMTDGMNTKNRWSTNASEIDARTRLVCSGIKAAGIKLYTIRVIEGNASLLRDCASSPDMYFEVTQASQMSAVFSEIASRVSTLRISR
jgi:Flp pilus assembly protein TadG